VTSLCPETASRSMVKPVGSVAATRLNVAKIMRARGVSVHRASSGRTIVDGLRGYHSLDYATTVALRHMMVCAGMRATRTWLREQLEILAFQASLREQLEDRAFQASFRDQ